jgi:iron complex outermembrane receptor protein
MKTIALVGQPESYNLYDINGNVALQGVTPANLIVTDFFGSIGNGSKVFPGFVQQMLLTKVNSTAIYGDLEYDVTEKWLLNGAVRLTILILETLLILKLPVVIN